MRVNVEVPTPVATLTVEMNEDEAEQLFAMVGGFTCHPSVSEDAGQDLYVALSAHFGIESDNYEVIPHPRTGMPCVARRDREESS